jgi:hypothetical protein
VRERIVDKRVLRLPKAFLHGGILTGHGGFERSPAPRKAESPLLASIALPALDGLSAGMGANSGQRQTCRRPGEATYPLGCRQTAPAFWRSAASASVFVCMNEGGLSSAVCGCEIGWRDEARP